jgi:hypothetical protein
MSEPYFNGWIWTIFLLYIVPASIAVFLVGHSKWYSFNEKVFWAVFVVIFPLIGPLLVLSKILLKSIKRK